MQRLYVHKTTLFLTLSILGNIPFHTATVLGDMLKVSFITPIIFLLMLSLNCQAEESDAPTKFYEHLRPIMPTQSQQNQSQNTSALQGNEKYYIVQPNESLSAIAARYGYNYVKLAKWNNLAPPYNVLTGQRLKLFDAQQNSAEFEQPPSNQADSISVEQELAQEQINENRIEHKTPLDKSARYYTVQPNESLSAIAARYGHNYIKLAQWNHLAPPYNVLAGQRLILFADPNAENANRVDKTDNVDLEQELEHVTAIETDEKTAAEKSVDNSPETKITTDVLKERYVVGKNETLGSIANRFGMSAKRLADLNNLSSPNQLYAGQKLKILKNKQKDSPLKMTENEAEIEKNLRDNAQKTSIISINNESMLKFYYQWPTTGKILKNFTQTGGRGIEIGGETGQAIRAAAAGKVVAVSPGIYGHGGFIVIQHDDRNISSYANIRRSLVTNGQRVKQGQVIAQMGQVGPKRPSLEFEIRKNGRVVNPLQFLPKKL